MASEPVVSFAKSPCSLVYNGLLPREIRLLRLNSFSFSSEVECSLEIVKLDDAPPFEALSYCWGDISYTREIIVSSTTFAVTKNLYAALSELRYPNKSRLVWIDAICVNQQDSAERSQQVQLMHDIYSFAERVVAWLGGNYDESQIAMSAISGLAEDLLSETALMIFQDERIIRPLLNLLKRPWWSRVWIVQEVALAKRITVMCGSATFDWEKFRSLVDISFKQPDMELDVRKSMYTPLMLCEFREFLPRPLLCVIQAFQRQEATDPRDKIYGFLGIVPEMERILIIPDYNLSVKEVYVHFTRSIIQGASNLNVLSIVNVNEPSEDFPSWLCDFRQTNFEYGNLFMVDPEVKSYNASSNSRPDIGILWDWDVLDVEGFLWDEIIQLGDSYDDIDQALPNPYISYVKDGKRLLEEDQPMLSEYIAGGTREDAFWRTLIQDQWMAPNTARFRRAVQDDVILFRVMCAFMMPPLPRDPDFVRDATFAKIKIQENPSFFSDLWAKKMSRLNAWRLLRTRKGYIGLCRNAAKVGDKISILLGGEAPFVLRQEKDNHRFVGECYVHGIMDGEAMSALEEEDGLALQMLHLC
ncbi:hypothetical protein OIDMADRAFT_174671 [Oidiodendron maius Zn]|uniref:Heterokaryon incompatibility domain-containing protein n=1 Tax=Oidiodendron maius (strain Zn) TaxID=913774 RepID=A0A0C3HXZ3_OIDMZ|nr:hypothetical protein OIDMADRAFT_174671 [Oidiodendron maius Zn]